MNFSPGISSKSRGNFPVSFATFFIVSVPSSFTAKNAIESCPRFDAISIFPSAVDFIAAAFVSVSLSAHPSGSIDHLPMRVNGRDGSPSRPRASWKDAPTKFGVPLATA